MRSSFLEQNSSASNWKSKVQRVTADLTLVEADSGKLLFVNPTAETTITLPSVAIVGFNVKVIATEDAASADAGMNQVINVDMGSGSNVSNAGNIYEADGAAGDSAVSGDDFVVMTANATPGDTFEFWSDGQRWYVNGWVKDLSEAAFSANATTIA